MAMLVETFEVPEVAACDGTIESDTESIELIERLGLEGQRELIHPTKPAERCPYRKMTAEEFKVYETILTKKTPISKYADEPIPLRVLQVAAHASELFPFVDVWHAPSADIKDPVLVGIKGSHRDYGERQYFLLARWGTELLPFAELRQIASKIAFVTMKAAYQKLAADVQSRMNQLTEDVALSVALPTVYWNE